MKSDFNNCAGCGAAAGVDKLSCPECREPLIAPAKRSIAVWRLGEVRAGVLSGITRIVSEAFKVPVVVQPSLLDPRPSLRPRWKGVSATAFLNQVDRRAKRGVLFSLGITEENIVPGAAWNYLFGYAYLGRPSCVVSLHQISSDGADLKAIVRRAAAIAIHEIGHNCGLDHHGYDDGIPCVMTADTPLDCLELLDEGTHKFCRDCQQVVDRNLSQA